MRKDRFTDEALRNAYALADLKYSENPEDQVAFEEAYDFARCQRPDGSFYGTSGQCRKGKESGAKAEEPKKARAPKAAAAAPAAPAASSGGMDLQKQVASDARAIMNRRAFDTEKGTKAFNDAKKRLLARSEQLGEKPGKQHVKNMVEELRSLEKQRGTVNYDRRRVSEILRALVVNDKKAAKEAGAGGGEPKPKKLKTDFRKDVEKGAAKRKAADEKRATRTARDNELRGQIREGMAALKPVKAELARRERAMKEVERRIKKDPSKENRANLRTLQRAVREQDRAVRKAEREIEKMAKERLRISKQNERERMTPAQRAEAARVRKIIKERG